MELELIDKPGIIIIGEKIIKTSKIKKYIEKNNINNYIIQYVENPSDNFAELNKQMQSLEDKYIGREQKQKQLFQDQRPYTHTYRLNCNTIFCAYSQEELNELLASSKLCNNEKISR